MTWFKVDDGLHSHSKWVATSPSAARLWVTAGSWCAAHLTNGHVPAHVLPMLMARPRDADELVHLGLWEEDGDGWRFHDWDRYQPSAQEVEAERAASRERQQRARDRARESRRTSRVTDAVSNGPPRHGPPDPTRPTGNRGNSRINEPPGDRPPPRRCSIHATWPHDAEIPACGACADARRAHEAWQTDHPDPVDKPLEEQQRAERLLAEEHMRHLAESGRNEIETDGSGLKRARSALRKGTPT